MGGHANYYSIIYHLIVLKGEFHRIINVRYTPIIEELSKYHVFPNSDNDHLPDHKQLAIKLNYTQSKMNAILKDLLKDLVFEFHYPPLKIEKLIHKFLIHLPWDEEHTIPNKKFVEESRQQSFYMEMILPIAPRLGEEIEIPFVNETGKFYRGYVHEVTHKITGTTQEIFYIVHPWDDYYHRWVKMKEECERRKRWRASS